MDLEGGPGTQLTVKFTTRLPPELQVPEEPLAVPTNVKRLALSKIINHLLQLEIPKPFDFSINGKLLRTSLKEFLAAEQISVEYVTLHHFVGDDLLTATNGELGGNGELETVVEIEYLPIVAPPRTKQSAVHDEWVSAIDCGSGVILSGSYDGAIRAWDGDLNGMWGLSAHETPVTDVKWVQHSPTGMILTSAQENAVKAWMIPDTSRDTAWNFAQLRGHKDVVQSIAVSPSGLSCCSASWDNTSRIWPCGEKLLNEHQDPASDEERTEGNGVSKKRKLDNENKDTQSGRANCIEVHASRVLEGHTGSVSTTKWREEQTIVTGGWDHSVRRWDAETGTNIDTHHGNKVVLDVSPCGTTGPIAIVGADPVLRLWDPRDRSETIQLQLFKSHSGWIAAVEWSRDSEFHVATASYDETVKLWDIRGSVPLGTNEAHEGKVLCIDWFNHTKFVSGAADCTIKLHSMD